MDKNVKQVYAITPLASEYAEGVFVAASCIEDAMRKGSEMLGTDKVLVSRLGVLVGQDGCLSDGGLAMFFRKSSPLIQV